MYKKLFLIIILCTLFTGFAYAEEYVEMEQVNDVFFDKRWTIRFNEPIDRSSVTTDNIYVHNNDWDRDVEIIISFDDDLSLVYVEPKDFYINSKCLYTLYIKNIISLEGNKLNPPVKMDFITSDMGIYQYKDYLVDIKAKEIVSNLITDDMDDFAKTLILYQYISNTVEYRNEIPPGMSFVNSDYDALYRGAAQCAGYARAFKALLDVAGVKNKTILSPGHEWNLVTIDGKGYHLDTTWDGGRKHYGYVSDVVSYRHFGLTDERLGSFPKLYGGFDESQLDGIVNDDLRFEYMWNLSNALRIDDTIYFVTDYDYTFSSPIYDTELLSMDIYGGNVKKIAELEYRDSNYVSWRIFNLLGKVDNYIFGHDNGSGILRVNIDTGHKEVAFSFWDLFRKEDMEVSSRDIKDLHLKDGYIYCTVKSDNLNAKYKVKYDGTDFSEVH